MFSTADGVIDPVYNTTQLAPLYPLSLDELFRRKTNQTTRHSVSYVKFHSEKSYKISTKERVLNLIIALAKTILSLGFALVWESTRENWKITCLGRKPITVLIVKSQVDDDEKTVSLKQIFVKAVRANVPLKDLPENLRDDEEVVLNALIHGTSDTLKDASTRLRGMEKIVLAAVEKHGAALEHASEELRRNKKIVLIAVHNYGYARKYISSKELQDDPEILIASETSINNIEEFSNRILNKLGIF